MSSGSRRRVRLQVQVVAIGASTGGLQAFQTILWSLPESFPAALLLVQHRMAEVESRLVELLRKQCRLPVIEPDDKEPILGGSVYLAPAGYHMLAEASAIALSTDPPVSFARPSIDALFESVADAFGDRAVGVVLTGANHDGAAGAKAIKDAGGRVLVQDPKDAVSPELPRAVLGVMRPDGVLPLSAIADQLVEWCMGASSAAKPGRSS